MNSKDSAKALLLFALLLSISNIKLSGQDNANNTVKLNVIAERIKRLKSNGHFTWLKKKNTELNEKFEKIVNKK
jgi:hypothetical protein